MFKKYKIYKIQWNKIIIIMIRLKNKIIRCKKKMIF